MIVTTEDMFYGLVRKGKTPEEAYHRMDKLITESHLDVTVQTAARHRLSMIYDSYKLLHQQIDPDPKN